MLTASGLQYPVAYRLTSRLPRPQAFLLFFVEVKALVEAERVPESSVTYINARCVAEEQLGSVVNVGEFLNQCACVRACVCACVFMCVCKCVCQLQVVTLLKDTSKAELGTSSGGVDTKR